MTAPYVVPAGRVLCLRTCAADMTSMPEPTVRFHGEHSEGFRALAIALQRGLPVLDLRRYWAIIDGEPTGPYWELTFRQRRLQ